VASSASTSAKLRHPHRARLRGLPDRPAQVYTRASYVAINISSPNTKNLRQLQGGDELDALLTQLKAEQEKLAQQHGKYVPLALKIAPDLDASRSGKSPPS